MQSNITEQPPAPVREALIENVPILIGRADAQGLVLEIEGSIPQASALGEIIPGQTRLADLLPDNAEEIRDAVSRGDTRFDVRIPDASGLAHFEVRMVFDRRRGGGAYFLIHDVTETRQLQVALLDCTDHEQMRVGQELHDSLGQELTGIAYQLHALRERMGPDSTEKMDALQERVSACLKQTRDIAFALSPHIEGSEITGAFERLCSHIHETFNVECVFESHLDHPIADTGVALSLFRIAQEACTNAVRHGAANRIEVHLSTGLKNNRLEITDDGSGISADDMPGFPGMGIPSMKFRAQAIGGALRIAHRPPSGTLVRCHFENKHSPEADAPRGDQPCTTCS